MYTDSKENFPISAKNTQELLVSTTLENFDARTKPREDFLLSPKGVSSVMKSPVILPIRLKLWRFLDSVGIFPVVFGNFRVFANPKKVSSNVFSWLVTTLSDIFQLCSILIEFEKLSSPRWVVRMRFLYSSSFFSSVSDNAQYCGTVLNVPDKIREESVRGFWIFLNSFPRLKEKNCDYVLDLEGWLLFPLPLLVRSGLES